MRRSKKEHFHLERKEEAQRTSLNSSNKESEEHRSTEHHNVQIKF